MALTDAPIQSLLRENGERAEFSSNQLYQTLDATTLQIRLVTIEPGPHSQETVYCTLQTVSLPSSSHVTQAPPCYEALSYVWGSPNSTVPITLNGHPFPITQNLASALRHLRPSTDDPPRPPIWIDAISINQADLSERAAQVSKMRTIYSLATTTIVWLGPATTLSRAAYDFLYAVPVPAGVDSVFVDSGQQGASRGQGVVPRAYKELVEEMFRDWAEARDGLVALNEDVARRTWWRRVWVIQELAVSRSVVLKCGADEIPWQRFSHIVQILDSMRPRTYFADKGDLDVVVGLDDMRLLSESRFPVLPISHLVVWNYGALATDPRDKIFSLTGLATDTEMSSLGADYTVSMQEVCEKLVLHSIERDRSLDLICWNSGRTRSESWPSWLPAFDPDMQEDVNNNYRPLLYRFREISFFKALLEDQNPSLGPSSRLRDRYTAASTTPPEVRHHPPSQELLISGILIDKISATTPINQPSSYQFLNWEQLILSHFGDTPAPLTTTTTTSPSPTAGLRITSLATGCTNNSSATNIPNFAPHAESPTLARWLQLLWRRARYPARHHHQKKQQRPTDDHSIHGNSVFDAYGQTLTLDPSPRGAQTVAALAGRTAPESGEAREATTFMWRVGVVPDFVGRRFMISEERGYLGLVPGGARVGDVVCVLFGCSVPVVLREVGGGSDGNGDGDGGRGGVGRYVLIGECFVEGLMGGEAITLLNEGVLQESEFALR